MNRKSNAVMSIDLTIRFKRQITLRELLKWSLPLVAVLIRLTAHLHGGP